MDTVRVGLLMLALGNCTPAPPANEPADGADRSGPPWTVVRDRAGLTAALEATRGRPLLLDVTASWCEPCVQLAAETFADRRVATALADHRWIALDVSDGNDAQLELQAFLGAAFLPHVLRYDDGAVLLEALRAGARSAPPAALELGTFLDADALLAALARP